MKKMLKNKCGYSLVELMAVIAIMAILAAASTPVYKGYIKKAKASEHLADCRAVCMASETYFVELTGKNDHMIDLEEVEEKVSSLTSLDVRVLKDVDETLDADYGLVLSENRDGMWRCEAVICDVEDDRWMFDVESGVFDELK